MPVRAAQGRLTGQGGVLRHRVPTDRDRSLPQRQGGEFCNAEIDALLVAFGIARSVSKSGNPYDNAVVESANHVLKREHVADRGSGSEDELRIALFDWVNRYDNFRIHSTLGHMSPVEFREAGLVLSLGKCCHNSHIMSSMSAYLATVFRLTPSL